MLFNLWTLFAFTDTTGEFTIRIIISKVKQENPANLTGLNIHPALLLLLWLPALCQKLNIFKVLFFALFLKISKDEFLAILTFLIIPSFPYFNIKVRYTISIIFMCKIVTWNTKGQIP